MQYFLVIYAMLNSYILGRVSNDFPTPYRAETMARGYIAIFAISILYLVFGVFIAIWDYIIVPILKFPFFVRKSHVQIGSTCYVWGGGLYNRDGKFFELSEYESHQHFLVKRYKLFSIVKDAPKA